MNDYVQDPVLLKSPTNVFRRRERMLEAIPYTLAKPHTRTRAATSNGTEK